MDDILSSIRNILNEDEHLEAGHPPLELTEDMLVPTPKTPAAPQETAPPAAPAVQAPPVALPTAAEAPAEPAPALPGDALLGPVAAAAAAAALGQLARAVADDRKAPVQRAGGPSIEDVVREELRPLLKSWLDQHLPPLVERLVKAEIERVLGRAAG